MNVQIDEFSSNVHFFPPNFFCSTFQRFNIFLFFSPNFFFLFSVCMFLQVFGGAKRRLLCLDSYLSICMSVCWILHTFVPNFMHLEPPLILYGCPSAKPLLQRDFALSKIMNLATGLETGCKPVLLIN